MGRAKSREQTAVAIAALASLTLGARPRSAREALSEIAESAGAANVAPRNWAPNGPKSRIGSIDAGTSLIAARTLIAICAKLRGFCWARI